MIDNIDTNEHKEIDQYDDEGIRKVTKSKQGLDSPESEKASKEVNTPPVTEFFERTEQSIIKGAHYKNLITRNLAFKAHQIELSSIDYDNRKTISPHIPDTSDYSYSIKNENPAILAS